MKIKITSVVGPLVPGQMFDAAVSPSKQFAVVFDDTNIQWGLSVYQFEIIKDESTESTDHVWSLRDLLGQDVKTIEFK